MLYVLVNNDYQLHSLHRHNILKLSKAKDVTLITVPHTMSQIDNAAEFHAVWRFDTPVGCSPLPGMVWRYLQLSYRVRRNLKPRVGDTLLFFTEAEWLNHIVVQHFRCNGARIIMVEDGGFATYIPMSVADSEQLSMRERCIQMAFRLVPGINRSQLFKVNGQLFPRLPDNSIDAFAIYRNVRLMRTTPTHRVFKPKRKHCEVHQGSVVFLNERMYDHYQSASAYMEGLRRLMSALTVGFDTVHFKYHPRETEDWKQRIRQFLVLEFPDVNIIDTHDTIEKLMLDYRPEVLASYFSAGLLSIEYEGIEPMYLYQLLDDLVNQPVFVIATKILNSWGYRFVQNDGEVRSGYQSKINDDNQETCIELQELLHPAMEHKNTS